ncbi:MAG: B-box zinc finger protein [Methanocellales archaeon]
MKSLNCVNHPQNQAIAICNNCGKSICNKCLEIVSGKNYCGDCASAFFGEHVIQKASLWWYFLPILFGIAGGVIGYLFFRKVNPKMAVNLLLAGLISNAIWLSIAIYNISVG